jgi:aspartate aminotransferase
MPSQSDRIDLLSVSPIRRVAALLDQARERRDLISLAGGAPNIPPPVEVLEEIGRVVRENPVRSLGYTGTRGIPELRRALSDDAKKYSGVEYDPEKEILVTHGATEAIYAISASILNKNDEVILIDPTYLGYKEAIIVNGGRVRWLPVSVAESYQPSLEKLKGLVSSRTKAFILLSPDNPTGRIVNREFAKGLSDLARDHDFWIISDEAYRHIVYESEHVWIAGIDDAKERTIIVNSFSKEASVPGLRLGCILAPSQLSESLEKILQYTHLSPNTLGQFAMLKFLENGIKERYLSEMVLPTYRKRRDVMAGAIKEHLPQARTVVPMGAFYFLVDMGEYMRQLDRDERETGTRLIHKKSVVVVPGSYFGKHGEQHFRMTFVTETEERIREGISRIAEYLFSYVMA